MPAGVQPKDAVVLPIESYTQSAVCPGAELVGGKAARLVWLAKHGFEIPRTWIIDAQPFQDLVQKRLGPEQNPKALLAKVGCPGAEAEMAEVRESILHEPLPESLCEELSCLWQELAPQAPWGLAVRSSATCEDAELTSMAGLATSVLGVRGPEQLAEAIRQVWASAVLPRALFHLAYRGLTDISMAVVLQIVVQAQASGVMFTRPPAGVDARMWARDERLVNATFGLGAPIVNGAVSPDMLRFSALQGAVRSSNIAPKRRALVVGEKGPDYQEIPPDQVHLAALSPQHIAQLARIADRLEQIEDVAHDVEFAVEQDRVLLVQARPVVGTGFPQGGDEQTIWSRANVGEALPGVATPLTWSVAQGFSERGFRHAFAALGCSVPENTTLVTNVHGRFYLNLTAFMRIAAQVPGMTPRTLLRLSGGTGAEELEHQVKSVSRLGFLAQLPLTATRLLAEQVRLKNKVDAFDTQARALQKARQRKPLAQLTDKQLADRLRLAQTELDETGTLMLACASASLAAHLALKTLLSWVIPDDAERLTHVLTAGVPDLESAQPGIALAAIAKMAKLEPVLARGLIIGQYKHLEELPFGPTRIAMQQFLEAYGDRAVREPELSTPRWREDPSPLFAMLGAALQNPDHHLEEAPVRARAKADQEWSLLKDKLNPITTSLAKALILRTQHTTQLRERMRAWVTRVLGAIRRLALEADRRLREGHADLEPGAVFFCTCEELLGALEAGRSDLSYVVRMRKAEFLRDERRPDPPVTFTGRPSTVVLPPADGNRDSLQGLAASAGVVEGRVRVLTSDHDHLETIEPGEILVARTTDVGLTPLFLLAAGVVTELGGPLSHAALVAREYGVPAVVNVAGATVALRSGDYVRVDGNRGLVERLDAPSPPTSRRLAAAPASTRLPQVRLAAVS